MFDQNPLDSNLVQKEASLATRRIHRFHQNQICDVISRHPPTHQNPVSEMMLVQVNKNTPLPMLFSVCATSGGASIPCYHDSFTEPSPAGYVARRGNVTWECHVGTWITWQGYKWTLLTKLTNRWVLTCSHPVTRHPQCNFWWNCLDNKLLHH